LSTSHSDLLPVLVADVGGTNVRFALADRNGVPGPAGTYAGEAFPGLAEAARQFIAENDLPGPRSAVLAVASPVTGNTVRLTNSPWRISAPEFKNALGLERVVLINDFAAQALALPFLESGDLQPVGGEGEPSPAAKVVLGPGTGLGVAALLPGEDAWLPLAGEGGHVAFAPGDRRQQAVVDVLRARFKRVSAERILSGPGLVNIYQALTEIDRVEGRSVAPADVAAYARSGDDPHCAEAVAFFTRALGAVAGDFALTFGARGGVYISGGVVRRLGTAFDGDLFRAGFEDKGRFTGYVAAIPTYIVVRPNPALLGAAQALRKPGPGAYIEE